jgi:sphingosine kinase
MAACNLNGKDSDAPKHNISKLKHSMSYNTTLDCPECHGDGDCENCDTEFDDVLSLETSTGAEHCRPRLDSWYSATSRKSAYFSTADSIYKSINEKLSINESNIPGESRKAQMFGPGSNIPAITTPAPESWTTLTGDFVMVHAAYQTHLAGDCFFAPSSKLNDGLIWLLIIKAGVSRSQLLSFLLSLSTGTHIPDKEDEHISMIPVTAFRIEPKSQNGIMTVDGEHVEHGPIQGEIFPGMLNVIVPQSNDGGVNR